MSDFSSDGQHLIRGENGTTSIYKFDDSGAQMKRIAIKRMPNRGDSRFLALDCGLSAAFISKPGQVAIRLIDSEAEGGFGAVIFQIEHEG